MNKTYLLTFALLLPIQAIAIEQDSVYTWGQWSDSLQPAAGPVARVTPPPAKTPNVNFRPNENAAFLREASVGNRISAPPIGGAPQIPGVSITDINTPAIDSAGLNTGSAL